MAAHREDGLLDPPTPTRFDAEEADFICECADPQCAHRVSAELEEYEEVRAEPTHFLLAPGHHEPKVERIIEHSEEFDVVEKVAPLMRRIVRRLNPRTHPGTA